MSEIGDGGGKKDVGSTAQREVTERGRPGPEATVEKIGRR